MAVQFSSKGIPCCGFSPPIPLRCLPQPMAVFAWVCSPIPRLQLPDPLHTRGCGFESRVSRTVAQIVCMVLTLSRLSQISWFITDSLKFFPSVPIDFPGCGNLSFPSATPPWGVGLVLLALLGLLASFFHLSQLCVAPYGPFWWLKSPASSVQPVFCENFCICRGIPDASLERDALHVHPLPYHLGKPQQTVFT